MRQTLALLILSSIILTACGFHPVYGINKYTSTSVESKLAQITIGNIPNREGQTLRNALIDRFYLTGRPQSPSYSLSIEDLNESITKLDITKDANSTRAQLKMTLTMTLHHKATGETLLKRNLTSIASYNILASEFTNRVSEQNTRDNILDDLANQTERHIALYFKKEE